MNGYNNKNKKIIIIEYKHIYISNSLFLQFYAFNIQQFTLICMLVKWLSYLLIFFTDLF